MQRISFLQISRFFHRSVLIFQKSLLLQFLVCGVCFALLFPPFRTPDEASHFLGGLTNISKIQGKPSVYCGKSVTLPIQFVGGFEDRIGARAFDLKNIEETCTDAWTYGWLINYPSILIAKFITSDGRYNANNSLLLFYLSRLINGILVIAVFGRAIAFVAEAGIRSGMLLTFSFLLSALFMQQSWSVTADVPVNLLAIYLGLVLFYFPFLKRIDLGLFFALGFIACSSKPVIAPLVPTFLFLAFAINQTDKKDWKSFLRSLLKDRFFLAGTASAIIGIATGLFQIGAEKGRGNRFIAGQLEHVAAHPWEVFQALNAKLLLFFEQINHFYNTPLGYFKLRIPDFIVQSLPRITVLFCVLEALFILMTVIAWARRKNPLSFRPAGNWKIVLTGTSFAAVTLYFCSLLPIFMMYLVWTPVGSPVVEGVQARYFYPTIFCLLGLAGSLISWVTQQRSYTVQFTSEAARSHTSLGEWVLIGGLMIVGLCYWMSLFQAIVLQYFVS